MEDCALIIFIKNPELGKVKTRIAKDVGDQTALSIYHRLLDHTRTVTHSLKFKKYLYYSEEILDDEWSEDHYHKMLQKGTDLGEKMLDAFIEALSYHKKAVIIGSDCIYLTPSIISEAFAQLDSHDKVIGPARDGGYYLLGMKQTQTNLFINVPWSSGNEFNITKQRIIQQRSSLHELETLNDIDHIGDWEEYLQG